MTPRETLEIRVRLLRFFSANPFTVDTLSGIALRIGRLEEEVRTELERLVALGILRRSGEAEKALYSYVRPQMGKRRS
mgnify:CR=1 FL=1